MSYRVASVQSNYIPWKGYFDLIDEVDEFVLLDEVQYTRRDWRNRNQIKTPRGVRWLTIPVSSKSHRSRAINEIRIADPEWARSHWSAIQQAYRGAPEFEHAARVLEPAYRGAGSLELLSEVNHTFLCRLCSGLEITTKITWSSDYPSPASLSQRLLDICQGSGATEYVSGPRARAYLDVGLFEQAGIEVSWFDYSGYPEYRQLHGPFTHRVSIVDLLFCEGNRSRQFLKARRVPHFEPVPVA